MIGPWAHNMSVPFAGINFGDDSSAPIRAYQIEWFDRWLKGSPDESTRYAPETWHQVRSEVDEAPVHIFVMGANRWRDEQEWPLARARNTPMYFSSRGHANSLSGDGKLEWKASKKARADQFTYDPRNPGAHARRRGMLRSEDFCVGPDGSASGGEAGGRAGVYQRAIEAGPGGDRAGASGAVRLDVGAGYGFHRQAGGRVSERGGAQSDGRHATDPLSARDWRKRSWRGRAKFIL